MNTYAGSIGLFDSGIGGLTVVKTLKEILPNEKLIYIGDTANLPFGPKPRQRLQTLSYRLIGYLLGRGVKLIVVACNTSTPAIFPEVMTDFKVPIIGPVKAGAEEAYFRSGQKRIGVIATEGTVRSGIYQKSLLELDPEIKVISQAAPGLVEAVERGEVDSPATIRMLQQYLSVFIGKIDTLILGCTHYPFLKPAIESILSEEVLLIDPAIRLAQQVKELLVQRQALNNGTGNYEFWATDVNKLKSTFLQRASKELGISPLDFKQLDL